MRRPIRAALAAGALGCAWIAPWLASAGTASAAVVTFNPSKDNTLFESAAGDLSSGAGPDLYFGATSTLAKRRAVLAFDLSSIPAGSVVTAVTLTLSVTQAPLGGGSASTVEVHRVAASWGEGASSAASGGGATALTDDATWLHRFYNTSSWTTAGGDFDAAVLASTGVTGLGAYSWTSAALAAGVQGWVNNPATNFGWILTGGEATAQSARKLGSRENADASVRPVLSVTYTPVPEPAAAGVVVASLVACGAVRRRRAARH
jgi:hypothetical protein